MASEGSPPDSRKRGKLHQHRHQEGLKGIAGPASSHESFDEAVKVSQRDNRKYDVTNKRKGNGTDKGKSVEEKTKEENVRLTDENVRTMSADTDIAVPDPRAAKEMNLVISASGEETNQKTKQKKELGTLKRETQDHSIDHGLNKATKEDPSSRKLADEGPTGKQEPQGKGKRKDKSKADKQSTRQKYQRPSDSVAELTNVIRTAAHETNWKTTVQKDLISQAADKQDTPSQARQETSTEGDPTKYFWQNDLSKEKGKDQYKDRARRSTIQGRELTEKHIPTRTADTSNVTDTKAAEDANLTKIDSVGGADISRLVNPGDLHEEAMSQGLGEISFSADVSKEEVMKQTKELEDSKEHHLSRKMFRFFCETDLGSKSTSGLGKLSSFV